MKNHFDRYNHRKLIEESECRKVEILNRKKMIVTKIREVHPSLLQKKAVFLIRKPEKVKQQVTPTIQILIRTRHYRVKQSVVKSKILECVRVGEKVMFRIQMK